MELVSVNVVFTLKQFSLHVLLVLYFFQIVKMKQFERNLFKSASVRLNLTVKISFFFAPVFILKSNHRVCQVM